MLFPKNWKRLLMPGVLWIAAIALATPSAFAIPILQVYIEGSTYDTTTESWTVNQWSFSNGPLRIWTIGNVAGPGGKGKIANVNMSIAYDNAFNPVINLIPSLTGSYSGFFDSSTPLAPVYNQTVNDGSAPILADGSSLPPHGVYGAGTAWQEFSLGNFDKTDSPMADFIGGVPTTLFYGRSGSGRGQINVYELTAVGNSSLPVSLHIDLYGSHLMKKGAVAVFAPFSHDANLTFEDAAPPSSTGVSVPEPSALLLLGFGMLALVATVRSRRLRRGFADNR